MRYTTDGLKKAGLALTPPFGVAVSLDPEGDEDAARAVVEFTSVARALPGRRISGLAVANGVECFAKIFYGPSARRYWHREIFGSDQLRASDVPTAAILRRGATDDARGFVILFEALPESRDVTEDDGPLIAEAVDLVARVHDAGLVQADVHLPNFVYNDNGMFLVDADSIRAARPLRVQFANLGLLLAQRQPRFDREIPELLAALCERARRLCGEHVLGRADVARGEKAKGRYGCGAT